MSEREWMPGVCNESAGFLFHHDCFRAPAGVCSRCAKPVCSEHQREMNGANVCIQCAKRRVDRTNTSSMRGRRYHNDYYDDPYFYGGYHYYGYHDNWRRHHSYYDSMHNDPNDFTDADAGSLNAGDEDFEEDFGES